MTTIENYIEALYASLPESEEIRESRLALSLQAKEQEEELRKQGKNKDEIAGIIVGSIGSLAELKEELGLTALEKTAMEYETELAEQYALFHHRQGIAIAISAFLYVLSPFMFLLVDYLDGYQVSEVVPSVIFFIFVAIATVNIIYWGAKSEKYERFEDSSVKNPKYQMINNVVWVVLFVLYLLIGFFLNLWHPGWVIFLLGIATRSILTYLDRRSGNTTLIK